MSSESSVVRSLFKVFFAAFLERLIKKLKRHVDKKLD